MKLRDRFKEINNCKYCDMPYCDIKCTILSNSELDKLEKITEEFAIGFGEWINNNRLKLIMHETEILWHYSNLEMWITTKELLEIYKTENRL